MANKVGALIKEARTGAGLTQEQLARKIKGISADDISKAERGEKELTQAVLKEIAKATGVTQKSLLDAAKGTTASKTTAQKKTTTASKKPASSAKKTTSSTKKTASAAKKTTSAAKKTASAAKKTTTSGRKTTSQAFTISTQEKKLINAYREADDKVKAAVNLVLLGTDSLASQKGSDDMLSALLGGLKDLFMR